ncbi:predicted protein [Chaetomium globosum CBS 148.51]|uniref:FAR1 domain-containing protein n=1 Tax=Chaetomium globosum (strain ATCC 6205 / CBS 148.51 / DSM 1962 / NBRC 6347 / NRRL 1970) TaxID=306901 RepID=Q2GUM9_CHAGB|nr:uncharacterized protein CHGG_08325 [Chaetomium globosum CBS 148.51]EAQ87072.1 predicted protein [Chaetomium globosum CBS 148.51]
MPESGQGTETDDGEMARLFLMGRFDGAFDGAFYGAEVGRAPKHPRTFAMTEHSTEPIPRPCGPPPPVKIYESLDDLFQDICTHGQEHGYSIVRNGKNGLKYKFRCAKARKYKDQRSSEIHESKRRKSSTQMTGCKFH